MVKKQKFVLCVDDIYIKRMTILIALTTRQPLSQTMELNYAPATRRKENCLKMLSYHLIIGDKNKQ
jgi:hypothetical protein